MQISRKSLIGLLLVLALSASLDVIVAWNASPTTDEWHHLKYGEQILHDQPDRVAYGINDSQMPVSALNVLPAEIASYLSSHHVFSPLSEDSIRMLQRFPTILATLALGLLVFLWAFDLYGEEAALASCLLCTLSPNLIAHGTLVTTDMYNALGTVGALYFLRRFLLQPTVAHALVSALALALAQVAKSFAIVLYGVAFLAIAFVMLRPTPGPSLTPRRVLQFAALAALCFLLVINAAFCFDRSFTPVSSYLAEASHHHIERTSFSRIQRLSFLGGVPIPFPYPFVQGLVLMKSIEETGATSGNIYLLGELRDPRDPAVHGFKSYYAVAYFYKEPIALQILFIWGLVWICRNRMWADFIRAEGLLLVTAAILFLWLSLFSRAQVGIRHILPVLAIETIIGGAAFRGFGGKPWPQKAALGGLVLWLAASMASYYPQMIPYMNEWLHDRRFAYRILADSNLDWGQDAKVVTDFLHKNPDVVLDPPKPMAGRILVRANCLTGVYRWDSATYLQRYQPVAQVGYAHFLFVVPNADVAPVSHAP